MKQVKKTKDETLRVRLTSHQMKKLRAYAARRERTVSHVITEYIRRLPNAKEETEI